MIKLKSPAEWQGIFYVGQDRTATERNYVAEATRRRRRILQAGFFLNFKFQNPEKFIMKKTANKCSKNSSIFEMGMLLYIKRKRIYVRKICSDIIDQRIRAIFICLT